MKYYIVYKKNSEGNHFYECNHENEMIEHIKNQEDSDIGNYEVYLQII